jgi:hypothetical protein
MGLYSLLPLSVSLFQLKHHFLFAPIAKALVDAHKRGERVEAILDKSQRSEKYTSAAFLANSRIPTFIDARHAIAHPRQIYPMIKNTGMAKMTKARHLLLGRIPLMRYVWVVVKNGLILCLQFTPPRRIAKS